MIFVTSLKCLFFEKKTLKNTINIGICIKKYKNAFRKNREIASEKMSFEIKKITIKELLHSFKKNRKLFSSKIENYYIYPFIILKLKEL